MLKSQSGLKILKTIALKVQTNKCETETNEDRNVETPKALLVEIMEIEV